MRLRHSLGPRVSRLLPLAAAAVAAVAATPARAASEVSPYYLGITQGFTADTNVFRAAKDEPNSRDLISATGLTAGIDQPFGRMRLGAKANVAWNNFVNNKQLNNTSHDVVATLEGSTIGRLSGDVTVYDRSNLNRYDLSTDEGRSTGKDMLHVTGATLRARVGVVTQLSFDGGFSYEESDHSLEEFANRDVRQGALNLGLRFAPSDLWSVRLGARRTEGEYPKFIPTGTPPQRDEFTRDDIDLMLTWVPTANSAVDARISRTKEDHSVQGQRDASFLTGLVGYDWTLTGKTRMRFQYARDSSAGRSDSDLALITESSDTQVRNAFLWRTTWDATSKIRVAAGVGYSRRTLDNAFTLASEGGSASQLSTAKDRLTNVSLSASWQALRNLRFACGLAYENRTVESGQDSDTTYPYDVTTGNCNLSLTLR